MQWYHSLANYQIFKSRSVHFCASSHRFRDINILRLLSKSTNVSYTCLSQILPFQIYIYFFTLKGTSQREIFAITAFDGKCQNLQISLTRFYTSSYRFRDIKITHFLPPRSRSILRNGVQFSQLRIFDGKCQNLHISSTHFLC